MKLFWSSCLAILLCVGVFLGQAAPALAQAENPCLPSTVAGTDLTNCYKLNDSKNVKDVYNTPGFLVNLLVRNGFILAGIIFFCLLIYSGFLIVTGGTKGAEQAKTTLEVAVIGFLLMFAAYWIVQIIKVITGANILL